MADLHVVTQPKMDLPSSVLVSTHKGSSPFDDADVARVLPQLRTSSPYSYHDSLQTSRQDGPPYLHLALSHGAYTRSHTYLQRHSSSTLNRLCQAEGTSTNEWTFALAEVWYEMS